MICCKTYERKDYRGVSVKRGEFVYVWGFTFDGMRALVSKSIKGSCELFDYANEGYIPKSVLDSSLQSENTSENSSLADVSLLPLERPVVPKFPIRNRYSCELF